MSAGVDTDLAAVAGQLYGALMETRAYVATLADSGRVVLTEPQVRIARRRLERIDAALAEGGEYMGSDARWPT